MPEFVEMTASKFTFRVATDRLYTAEGVWLLWLASGDGARVRVGLTDFLQQHSGDVAFYYPPAVGATLAKGDDLGVVETMKTTVTIACPVMGAVAAVNEELELHPEQVNQEPYGRGWLAELEATSWEDDRTDLLEPAAYFEVMRTLVEKELKSS